MHSRLPHSLAPVSLSSSPMASMGSISITVGDVLLFSSRSPAGCPSKHSKGCNYGKERLDAVASFAPPSRASSPKLRFANSGISAWNSEPGWKRRKLSKRNGQGSNAAGRSTTVTCSFAPGGNAKAGTAKLPDSREEAIRQAQASLAAVVGKSLNRVAALDSDDEQKRKKQPRFRVEIPVLDDSPSSSAELCHDLIKNLFTKRRNSPGICIHFGDPQALTLASKKFNGSVNSMPVYTHSLEEIDAANLRASGIVFIITPREDQVSLVDRLVEAARPRPCVVLNPDWPAESSSNGATTATTSNVVDSFQVCYSFMPLEIQGFLTKYEGAVLKFVSGGAVEGTPWMIFTKQGEKMKCVVRMNQRPEPQQLENALYQVTAATSPVGKTINLVSNLGKALMGKKPN